MKSTKGMTQNIVDNIKHLMNKKGVNTVAELSRAIKMNQPTMHRFLAGEVQDPKYVNLRQIAEFFGVTVDDLAEKDLSQMMDFTPIKHATGAPIVGRAQLGDNGHWADMEYPVGHGDGFINWPSSDKDIYAIKCVGDSMMPRIKNGEYVVVEPNHNYIPGDEVLVVTNDERVMVKTFMYSRDGIIYLLSINEAHPPVRISITEVAKVHYVAGIAKASLRSEV